MVISPWKRGRWYSYTKYGDTYTVRGKDRIPKEKMNGIYLKYHLSNRFYVD